MAWESAERVQKNAAGEFRALIGGEWVPVQRAQRNESGAFRVERAAPAAAETPAVAEESALAAAMRDPLGELAAGGRQLLQHGINLQSGAIRGAGSIGATLMRPFESAEENAARRAAITGGLELMGAQPNTLAFQTGKLGGEIAGTAGIGGVAAMPFQATKVFGRAVPALVNAPRVANALATNGMGANIPLWSRAAAGAATGAAGAGLIEPTPKSAIVGGLLGGMIPMGVQGAARARDWGAHELQTRDILRSLEREDPTTFNAVMAFAKANPKMRTREILGAVSKDAPGLQALLASAEAQKGALTASGARAAEAEANEAALAAMAGGSTQTEARAAVKEGQKALTKATTPLRAAAFADVDRAATLVQKGLQARGESSAAVEDVRRFTDMADRAIEWAKNWRATTTGAGTPAAARPPVRYTYPWELSQRAEAAAGAAADESLKAGARARAAENTADFMAARGVEPLKVSAITDVIDARLQDPEVIANEQLAKALRNVRSMAEGFASKSGGLGAAEYYAIRKNGIDSAVKSALGQSADPPATKKLTATILADLKSKVDPKLGPKFKTYLDAYTEGATQLSQQKLAAEALRLYKNSPAEFIKLIDGDNPKLVRKIMGGGVEDIKAAMGPQYAELERIANDAALQIRIAEQAAPGGAAASKTLAEAQRKVRIPNMLSRTASIANMMIADLEGKINRKALEGLTKAAQSGGDFTAAVNALPPSERSKALNALRKYGGLAAAPAAANAMSEDR